MGHALPYLKGWTRISFNSQYSVMCDLTSLSLPTTAVFSGAFGTKTAARAAYIIPCIWFFVLVSVMSKPAKKWPQHILAGGGRGSPGGSIHMPHVWPSRGWGATAQPGPQGGVPLLLQPRAVSWKKALKTPKGLVGILTYSMAVGGFSQQEQPQVCKKRRNSKKASTNQKRGFDLAVTFWAEQPWDLSGWSPSPRNAPTHTHSALQPRAPELPLSHKASFKTALLSHWDALGMGCTDNSP